MTKGIMVYSSKNIFFNIFSTLNWMLTEKFTDRSIKEINKQKVNQDIIKRYQKKECIK